MNFQSVFVGIFIFTVASLILCIFYSNSVNQIEVNPKVTDIPLSAINETSLLNLPDFHYVIQNDVCSGNFNISAVQIVTSFAGNVEARSALRQAYPSEELAKLGIVRVFLLATLRPGQSLVTQFALEHENSRFHDIIQGSFLEAYKNLTYKHVMGLRWAVKRCSNLNYIIKMDDDIVVDMYRLSNFLHSELRLDMIGYKLRGMKPIRLKANKWYVSREEFGGSSYPNFLSGWLYVVSPQAAKSLVYFSSSLPYFWIDDLFLSGIVADNAGVECDDMKDQFTLHPEVIECCIHMKLTCDFIVGPSGGDYSLQRRFQKHSKLCAQSGCRKLKRGKTVESICVTERKVPKVQKGIPFLESIKL